MIFSKPVTYAIKALIHLAEHREKGPILSSTIASAQDIPPAFAVKMLGTLISAGFVYSVRGPGGGFSLLRSPDQITLYEVMALFERMQLAHECLLGRGVCSDDAACPIHAIWKQPKQSLLRFLNETTITDLIQDTRRHPRKPIESK